MLLKSLTLNNFRVYKGEQKIVFSTNRDKNVTVILGKNTSGKTTLIQAFKWVLYGKTDFVTADFLLNLEVASKLLPGDSADMKVVLELEHNDVEYIVTRKQKYLCISTGEVKPEQAKVIIQYKLPNGQVSFEKNYIDTINKILPEELSEYFFFDGERIGNLGSNNRRGRKDIANAVKGVLGLNVLDTTITHLSGGDKISVIGKLKNSIDTQGDKKFEQKKKTMEQLREKLNKATKLVDDFEKTIDYYSMEIEKKEKLISEHRDTAELKKEMDKNAAEISINSRNKEKKEHELKKVFSEKAPMFFMQPLLYKAIKMIEDYDLVDEGIPEMHSEAVDFLIKRGRCICGRKIEIGNEAYNNLMKQKNYLPPQSIGTMLRVFMTNANHFSNMASSFHEEFINIYKELRTFKKKISDLHSINESISDKIKDKPNIGVIEAKVRELKKKLNTLQRDREEEIKNQAIYKNEIDKLDKEIKVLASTFEKNKFVLDCIEYAEYILDILTTHYNAMEKTIRKKLEKKVNEIFAQMYHGNRTIKIDEDYIYEIETPIIDNDFQKKADESKGLETVTSFAFISGIVSLAKAKIDKSFGNETETYPLVMDAPFSNADEIHVENISKILPEVAEQVIMFIMHKDWKYAEKVLGPKLETMYELDKQSETYTIIRGEVNV
ncbi:MAG: AAA family ATPase [Clostridiales bacterium]|nr:AAA family ATPase [Clostridiales bacterium]